MTLVVGNCICSHPTGGEAGGEHRGVRIQRLRAQEEDQQGEVEEESAGFQEEVQQAQVPSRATAAICPVSSEKSGTELNYISFKAIKCMMHRMQYCSNKLCLQHFVIVVFKCFNASHIDTNYFQLQCTYSKETYEKYPSSLCISLCGRKDFH